MKIFDTGLNQMSLHTGRGFLSILNAILTCAAALALVYGALAGAPSVAQVVSATLTGSVTDSSGASVPNATVRAIDLATKTVRTTNTTSNGIYNLTFLNPGAYRVEIEASGFKTFSQDNLTLDVSTTLRVDATLALGSPTETVTVTAENPLLQVDRAEVAQNFSNRAVTELPLASRNFEAVAGILPGVSPPVQTLTFTDPANTTLFSANGRSNYANYTILDGVDDHDPVLNFSIYLPAPELVDEVHVATSNYAAEFGRVGGAVINVVTKSGSNDFHSTLWEFNRVAALTARDFFNVANPKPGYTRNDFGATFGGPIVKNKTFFMASYSARYLRQSATYTNSLPVSSWLSGNFSGVPSLALFDPNTGNRDGTGRAPIPNNVIPVSERNPIAQKLIQYFPQPNLPGYLNNYVVNLPSGWDTNSYDARVDHYFGEQTKFFAKMNTTHVTDFQNGALGPIGDGLAAHDYTVSSSVNLTHGFSPTLLTEIRLGFNRFRIDIDGIDMTTVTNQKLGIADPNPDKFSSRGVALMLINGMNPGGAEADTPGVAQIGISWGQPEKYTENLFSVVNSWSKVTGKHTFKWGGEVHRERMEQDQPKGLTLGPRGLFVFNPGTTQLKGGPGLGPYGTFGNSFASFLLGAADEEGRTYQVLTPTNRQTQVAAFLQDTYQLSRNLTLDVGVRYELFTTITPRYAGGAGNYDPTNNTYLIAGYGDVGLSTGVRVQPHNFEPRFGLAYRLDKKSVIRTGFGISYWQGSRGYTGGTLSVQFPSIGNIQQGQVSDSVVDAKLNSLLPIPSITLPTNGIFNPAPDQAFFAIPFYNPMPYVESYNFTYQRELVNSLAWEVGYVGNVGHDEPYSQAANASAPGTGVNGLPLLQRFGHASKVSLRGYGVNSHYNSLQTSLSKRLSHGLTFTFAYTYSKSMDVATNQGSFIDNLDFQRNYGPSDFDATHLVTISHQYALPFGKGKSLLNYSGPIGFLVSNWQLNGIYRYRSGTPFTPTADATSCNCTNNSQFAQVVAPVQYLGGVGPGQPWFSTSSFAAPPPNQFGNAGRNIIRGPSLSSYDFSVFRNVALTERFKLEYRTEFYNLTNTPQFSNPNAVVTSGTFGIISSTLSGYGNRQVQMALRLLF